MIKSRPLIKYIFVLIALILCVDLQAQAPPIKSIKFLRYQAKQLPTGEVVPGSIWRGSNKDGWYELRDKRGNVLEGCSLITSDSVYKDRVYIYDNSGKLIREEMYQRDGHELRDYWIYKYDYKGREILRENYSCYNGNAKPLPDFLLYEKCEKSYMFTGDEVISETWTTNFYDEGQSTPRTSTSRKYDYEYKTIGDKKYMISKKVYKWEKGNGQWNGQGFNVGEWEMDDKIVYAYDDKGNEIRKTDYSFYSGQESVYCTYIYIYDDDNRIVESITSYPREGFSMSEYVKKFQYDDKGRLSYKEEFKPDSAESFSGRVLESTLKNRYNENGDIIFQEQYDCIKKEKATFSMEYTYDKYGNNIKKVVWLSMNDEPLAPYYMIIKEINYYEPEENNSYNTTINAKKRGKRK